jgi:hypothetical protein
MARGTHIFDVSFILSLLAMVLAVPFVHEIYKDSFDGGNWAHLLRLSPFGFVSVLSIVGMVVVI